MDDFIVKTFNREVDYLFDGILNSKNPFHFFTLSTVDNLKSEIRTIVLRRVEKNPLRLFFNSDNRSNKIIQLKKSPSCSILFYDNERRVQLRMHAVATLHINNQLSKEAWSKTALQSRKCYMAPYAPSSRLNEWHPNIPDKYLKSDPEKEDSENGYINFCLVELDIESLDILELHHDGHKRFKVDFQNDESYFIAT